MLGVPNNDEQRDIHARYLGELVQGVFRDETRERILGIVGRMKSDDGIDGVILGGTELPLLLPEAVYLDLPFLDTTAIHVEAAVSQMLLTSGSPRSSSG